MTQDSQKIISISSLLFFFLFIIFPLNAEAHHSPYVDSFTSSASDIFVTVCNLWLAKLHVFSFDNFKHLPFNPIHVDNILLDFQKEQNNSLKNKYCVACLELNLLCFPTCYII